MPPRHQTLPPAATSSAREALQSFYCSLCSKGYSRMNDYEAHLSSYDHSHKQRLKDMKAMVRDPNAGARARKAEAKADGIIAIKTPASGAAPNGGGGGGEGGFKKGGFKKSGFKSAFAPAAETPSAPAAVEAPKSDVVRPPLPSVEDKESAEERPGLLESDTDDEDYDHYDPRYPTD
ncbi:G patch domain-containing protein 8 like [Verticillium longisporum]|uniref:G patch domain-containing protein 8 like n=2 Tax=Verticillium TaxID=1036719 RepID=A0A8I2ZMB0_VERLO|nr:G patch domain-containing protein 8 like [Verticillium longisporum]PNH40383.1 hypothetical protein VD0004_g6592 [Verticillium dahliae]PNH70925.1 hypothetical protein VD0001_g6639 [Verticillium dahliae]RXG46723.1 hypothetical protein VDGE_01650 [Verticillium dahliae]